MFANHFNATRNNEYTRIDMMLRDERSVRFAYACNAPEPVCSIPG